MGLHATGGIFVGTTIQLDGEKHLEGIEIIITTELGVYHYCEWRRDKNGKREACSRDGISTTPEQLKTYLTGLIARL